MNWGAIKRTPGDAAFSDYHREAADWTCQWPGCFKSFHENKAGLHLSHFKTRGNPRVRFDSDNVAVLCAHHHDHAGKNPDEHDSFFRRRLGEDRYLALIVRANTRRSERLDHKFEAIKWRAALKELRKKTEGTILGARS